MIIQCTVHFLKGVKTNEFVSIKLSCPQTNDKLSMKLKLIRLKSPVATQKKV